MRKPKQQPVRLVLDGEAGIQARQAPGEAAAAETPAEAKSSGAVDIEALARNLARLVEEGGKALAAYLRPREQGKIKDSGENIVDAVKSIAQVADYWLSDPQRAAELQANLGRAYLDLWAGMAKRLSGEPARPTVEPHPKDKRFADPEWSQNTFFDFLKQAYLIGAQWAERLVKDAEGARRNRRARAGSNPDRTATPCRRRISSSPIRSSCARPWRRTRKTSCAACAC